METYSFLIIFFCIVLVFFIRWKKIKARRNKQNFIYYPIFPEEKGKLFEESIVNHLINNGIPECTLFHDLYIKKSDGHYTQTDIVVVTTAGIIVIEAKNYSGWIFGNGHDKYWTQVLAYGNEKHRFYNPIIQNRGHIKAIRCLSEQFRKIPYYSIILFDKDCVLRDVSDVPNNNYVITTYALMNVINSIKENRPAPYTNKHEIVHLLRNCVLEGENQEVRSGHLSYTKEISSTPTAKTNHRDVQNSLITDNQHIIFLRRPKMSRRASVKC